MASIEKLQLAGVRAFDPYGTEAIQFNTPLTLICGPNGVGKTTIIEALSYATTGALPPNAKGGAFVHDPSMASEDGVLAFVKLLFKDAQGKLMVVSRRMKLTSSKGKATFKTLEGQLSVYRDEEARSAVSTKVADLNTVIPHSLGVSAPILNYVVFCHQEDSLWPLSEASIVKRRFDEIFEATKYSKAMESLKTIRKDYLAGTRVEKVNVEHLRIDCERAEDKRRRLESLEAGIRKLDFECTQIQEHRKTKNIELDNAVKLREHFQDLQYKYKDIQSTVTRLAQEAELLQSETKLMHEPSSALEKELADWRSKSAQLDKQLDGVYSRRQQLEKDAESLRQNLAVLSNQQGRIEQALEARNNILKKRADLAGENTPQEYRQELETRRLRLGERIDELEVSHRQEESELSQSVSVLEGKVLSLRQAVVERRSTIRDSDAKITELQALIDAHIRDHAKTDVQYMRSALADLESQTEEARKSVKELAAKDDLESAKSRIQDQESRATKARTRLQKAIEASGAQSRLRFLRASLGEVEAQSQESLQHIRDVLNNPSADVDDANAAIFAAENAKSRAGEKLSQVEADINAGRAALGHAEDRVKATQAELHELEQSLTIKPTEYESALSEAEGDVVVTTENREQAAFAHRFFAEALTKAREEAPVCLLCDHHKTKAEAEAFISRLTVRIEALPMSPELAAQEAEAARSMVEEIRSQAPGVQRWHQLNSQLEESGASASKVAAQIAELESRKKQLTDILNKAQNEFDQLNTGLSRHIVSFNRSSDDILATKAKIETETLIVSDTETETPQQAQEALDSEEAQLRTSREKLEELREEERQRQQRLQSLEQRVSSLKLRLSEYDLATSKRQQAEQAQSETREHASRVRKELEDAQAALPKAERAVSEAQANLRGMKHEFATSERDLAQERSRIVYALRQLDELEDELDAFEKQHGADPLGQIEARRAEAQLQLDDVDSALAAVAEELTGLERMQADSGSHHRRLKDNLRLRQLEEDLAVARRKERQVAEKHEKAQAQLGDYEHQISILQDAVSSANAEIATKTGEAKAMSEQMRQLRHELESSYKDTEKQFQRAKVQLESSEGAAEDLAKYVRALDGSIMSYHSLKMAEINSLLDELWKSTYTGTDIDTILIRSESDAASASTRASYNYRVCMVKQESELDMRGRCSAGQKVLASILIRMALAECFGNSLGLVVLDEPTTNLDHENIIALAQSLSHIISARQAQRNFQLIVITHDEHFLTQMSPANYCSSYYRIERNERQFSVIKRLPITSLQ